MSTHGRYELVYCNYESDKSCKHSSSFFLSDTYVVSFIFSQHSKENDGVNCIPSRVVVHDIVLKVNPRLLVLAMSMVSLFKVIPWNLCIVNAQATLRGISFLLLHCISGIGIYFGCGWSHGGIMYLSNSTTTYIGKIGEICLGYYTICITTPRARLTNPAWTHKLQDSI